MTVSRNARWILGVIGGLAILGITAALLNRSTPPSASEHRVGGRGSLSLTQISASDLDAAYNRNEVAASSTYAGATLRVAGTVNQIAIDRDGIPYVDFRTPWMGVRANFTSGRPDRLAQLSKGDVIAVRCICVGKSGVVHLKDCEIER